MPLESKPGIYWNPLAKNVTNEIITLKFCLVSKNA